MLENNFLYLLNWYHNHCHVPLKSGKRIHIGTIGNPGWSITINLEDTELENKKFHEIKIDRTDDDWLICFIKGNRFQGRCGSLNASEVLQIFQNWAEGSEKRSLAMTENVFLWLLNWYQNHCDGDWEHMYGIDIDTINSGWSVSINLQETELENKKFHEIKINRTEDDWLICFIKENRFEGRCGPLNAAEVLQIFRNWTENDLNSMDIGKTQA